MEFPNWVRKRPERYVDRLVFEEAMLARAFPNFRLHMEKGGVLYAEGTFVTLSDNRYVIRAYFPEGYPHESPRAVVMDSDVTQFCSNRACHEYHHLGKHASGGLGLCVLRTDGARGQGWKPEFSVVTVLNLAAAWLHAYEYKRAKGKWILPEA